jgi:two-component system cell cycle sensor histidine kinase/response regulator CckA
MQSGNMHSLLKRQLKRFFGDSFIIPEEWSGFFDMVNSAYHESDMDRNMLERSLELSSQELLQANSEMRAIFEAVPDIFFRTDDSGTIIDCKTGNTSDLLVSRQEIIGNKIFNIPLTPVADKFRKALEDVWRTNAAVSFEYSLILRGTENFYEARWIPILENQIIVIIRNVTDRKEAEKELLDSEAKMQAVFNQVDTGIMIIDSATLTIIEANKKVADMTGFPREGIIGKNCHALVCPAEAGKCPVKDLGLIIDQSERMLLHANGTEIDILKTVFPIMIKGRQCYLESFIDISDRKRAEEALRASEEHYRTIFESTATANIIIAEDTTILMANNNFAGLCGYTKQELEGKMSWTGFVHKDDLEQMVAYHKMRRTDPGSAPSSYEFRFMNRRGEVRELFMNIAVIPETKDSVASLTDLTERKQLETQLIQAQKMESVGRLAGGVAHDFNNMLSVIIGNTELAMEDIRHDEPLHNTLQDILNAGIRSADLTRQLLAFARKQTVSPKVLDLNDTINGMLKMLRRLIGEHIDLGWHPGPDLWKVKIDPSQVDQLLANLMVNARDAIEKTGRIKIETSDTLCDEAYCADQPEWIPGDYVVLAVSDDGCGMDKETLAHIFEPFYTTKKEGQGTGLGLATVYGIVKQNGGFINVYSEQGKGTAFRIYLPRYKDESVQNTGDEPVMEIQGGAETVLVVEDERSVLTLTQAMLERLGYKVLAAGGKDEALRLVGEYGDHIDLLLTDVVMPDMDGKELSERIIAVKPGLKCLYMSGYTEDVIARQGILDEGVKFVCKPFSLKILAAKVREALG